MIDLPVGWYRIGSQDNVKLPDAHALFMRQPRPIIGLRVERIDIRAKAVDAELER
jgi:hypothetical protein